MDNLPPTPVQARVETGATPVAKQMENGVPDSSQAAVTAEEIKAAQEEEPPPTANEVLEGLVANKFTREDEDIPNDQAPAVIKNPTQEEFGMPQDIPKGQALVNHVITAEPTEDQPLEPETEETTQEYIENIGRLSDQDLMTNYRTLQSMRVKIAEAKEKGDMAFLNEIGYTPEDGAQLEILFTGIEGLVKQRGLLQEEQPTNTNQTAPAVESQKVDFDQGSPASSAVLPEIVVSQKPVRENTGTQPKGAVVYATAEVGAQETPDVLLNSTPESTATAELLFHNGEGLKGNMDRAVTHFALESDELKTINQELVARQPDFAAITEQEMQFFYNDSLLQQWVASDLLVWSKNHAQASEREIAAQRNVLLQKAIVRQRKEHRLLLDAKRTYNKQRGYDAEGKLITDAKPEDLLGLGRYRLEKRRLLHEYGLGRVEMLQELQANVEQLVPTGNDGKDVLAFIEPIKKKFIEDAKKLGKEFGMSPWWVTLLLLLSRTLFGSVVLGWDLGKGTDAGKLLGV